MHSLRTKLQRFHKCKYSLYYGILGNYEFQNYSVNFDAVQADPFAPPSKMTVKIPLKNLSLKPEWIKTKIRIVAFCDFISRVVAQNIRAHTNDDKGSGNSCLFGIRYGTQKILESNSVCIIDDCLEIKLLVGLPAFGRDIAGDLAQDMFFKDLPKVLNHSVFDMNTYQQEIDELVTLAERQQWIREICQEKGIVSFIADGSILARASSISDKPMSHQKAITFTSPKELQISLTLPDGFIITGMAVYKGVTLIAGGGFHGKSTLLSSIAHAVYNHLPQDGREYCITDQSAVFLRAEEGRFVSGLDISPFIHDLPEFQSSTLFTTENASGSSSQAANCIEALEMNAQLLLIDEDISATNFLIRDSRMRSLVADEKETITPLIAHISNLKQQGVSIIMVTGALGDFMAVADRVIVAENYRYTDKTDKAKKIIDQNPIEKLPETKSFTIKKRFVDQESIKYTGKKGLVFLEGELGTIKFGREIIDMKQWHHLYDFSQYASVAALIAYTKKQGYFEEDLVNAWIKTEQDLKKSGWHILSHVGFDELSTRQEARKDKQHKDKDKTNNWRYIVETRPIDWHAGLCRLRSLKTYY